MKLKKKRIDAIISGDRFYNTGKSCIHGHSVKRWSIDGACTECRNVFRRKQRAEFKQRLALQDAE